MTAGRAGGAGLSTFAGVFTPSVLTILGLVLFLRLGTVIGGAGLASTLVIIVLATVLVVLTSVSLSAIATNLRIKAGGDYYLISRSLGMEFGGAIGIVLYLAQSISIAFYCLGLGLAVSELVPALEPRVIAAIAALFLFAFAWAGADVATRLQYVVMAALVAALASFFAGGAGAFSADTLRANWDSGVEGAPGFWVLFAIFFPAVTGFTQGVSMSGDLKTPGKSLPVGTFLAVGTSTVVYLAAATVLAGALPAETLHAADDSLARVSTTPWLIAAGLIAATLSSGLTSFLGAPRILQALAGDRVFPVLAPFAHGAGPHRNPRRGVLLSLGIALAFIALGGIDVIAPIVSMFFLISYGLLNYATAFEARAKSPSFRPRFRFFHYRASLAGAVGCLGVMLMINAWAAAIAVALVFGVYQYLDRMARPERWSDGKRDHYLQQLRTDLLALSRTREHPRSWRPRLLVFSDRPERRELLVRFASWIEGGAGLTTVARILEGRGEHKRADCVEAEEELRAEIASHGLEAFPLAVAAPDLEAGLQTVVQAHGLGALRVNTVVLNWLDQAQSQRGEADDGAAIDPRRYARQLRAATRIGVNVVVVDAKERAWEALAEVPSSRRRIDVWWRGQASSRLMLLLAYMMKRREAWNGATIRLLGTAKGSAAERIKSRLEETLEEIRIDAEVQTVPATTTADLLDASRDASLVFLPLRLERLRLLDPFGTPLGALLDELPLTALVLAVEDVGLEADPDEGRPAEIAAAADAFDAASAEAADLMKLVGQTRRAAREKLEVLRALRKDEADDAALKAAEAESRTALEEARRAARRASRALALAGSAEQQLGKLTGETTETTETTETGQDLAMAAELEIFFDGECPLCRREVAMMQRKDRDERLAFVDITAADFDAASLGVTRDDLMARMHGRLADGTVVTGVETFRQAYARLGFGWLVPVTRLPLIKQVLDGLYTLFARNRLRLTGRCEDDDAACEI